MKKVAISIGDINGVGLEIALCAHEAIKNIIKPVYFIDKSVAKMGANLLKCDIPRDFTMREIAGFCSESTRDLIANNALIRPAQATKESGEYSFKSFEKALDAVDSRECEAILTLPINKFAWKKAGIDFLGHTEFLRARYGKKGIMMLGCAEMFVALFSDHIPLNAVPTRIEFNALCEFLLNFYANFSFETALVLGLNPHAGDGGILGSEDKIIQDALDFVNAKLGAKIYCGVIAPDSAFRAQNRAKFKVFVAMYHDQGLATLKALYADKSINVTLGIPILRASVEHGTGFDIAYKGIASVESYMEAARFLGEN